LAGGAKLELAPRTFALSAGKGLVRAGAALLCAGDWLGNAVSHEPGSGSSVSGLGWEPALGVRAFATG